MGDGQARTWPRVIWAWVGRTMQRRGFWRPQTWMEVPWQKSRWMSLIPNQDLRSVKVWSVALEEPNAGMARWRARRRGTETPCHEQGLAGMKE